MATRKKNETKAVTDKKPRSAGVGKTPKRANAVTKTAQVAKATKTPRVKAVKTAGRNRRLSASKAEKVQLRTLSALSSVRTVDLLKQRIALHNVSNSALRELGDGMAQVFAIRHVLSTLLQAHAPFTWPRKNWKGTMKGDYLYDGQTFSVFLNEVAEALRPKYHFPHDDPKFDKATFDQKQLKGTVDDLVVAIDKVTTAA